MDSSDTETSFHEDDDNDTTNFSITSRSENSFSDGYECDTLKYNDDGNEYLDRIFIPYINSNERRRHHHYYHSSSKFQALTPEELDRISVLTPLDKIFYSHKKKVEDLGNSEEEKEPEEENKKVFQWNVPSTDDTLIPTWNMSDIMNQQKKEDEELQKQLSIRKRSEELIRQHEESKRKNRTNDHKRLLRTGPSHQRLLRTVPSTMDKTKKIDILCKNGKSCSKSCRLAHSFEEWKPKSCQYGVKCNRKKQCTFWHAEKETTREYLQRCINLRLKIFEKHYEDYSKLL